MSIDTAAGNDHLYAHVGADLAAADGTVYRWVDNPDSPWGGRWADPDGGFMQNAAFFSGAGIDPLALRPVRTARIERLAPGTTIASVQALLPVNYRASADGDAIVIAGADRAGWTLEGYVIPRLASSLIAARETTSAP